MLYSLSPACSAGLGNSCLRRLDDRRKRSRLPTSQPTRACSGGDKKLLIGYLHSAPHNYEGKQTSNERFYHSQYRTFLGRCMSGPSRRCKSPACLRSSWSWEDIGPGAPAEASRVAAGPEIWLEPQLSFGIQTRLAKSKATFSVRLVWVSTSLGVLPSHPRILVHPTQSMGRGSKRRRRIATGRQSIYEQCPFSCTQGGSVVRL